jgi:hypothetical protein
MIWPLLTGQSVPDTSAANRGRSHGRLRSVYRPQCVPYTIVSVVTQLPDMAYQPSSDMLSLLATPALDHHLGPRTKSVAPVDLTSATLAVEVTGTGRRRDCTFIERYRGVNVSPHALPSFDLKLDADFYATPPAADIQLFDLIRDPDRASPIQPAHVEESPYQKWITMPFAAPGVGSGDFLAVELRYSYPGVVNSYQDYWFFDPLARATRVRKLTFRADWAGTDLHHALHVRVDRASLRKQLQGHVPIIRKGARCRVQFTCVPEATAVDVFVLGNRR